MGAVRGHLAACGRRGRRAEAWPMAAARLLLVVGALLGMACAAGAPSRPASVVSTAGPAAADRPASTQALIPMQASYSALSMSMVPMAIAKEAGYFQEQGLDASTTFVNASAQNAAALLSGDVDVNALGGIGPIRARLGGSDLVITGATKPYFSDSVVVRPLTAQGAATRARAPAGHRSARHSRAGSCSSGPRSALAGRRSCAPNPGTHCPSGRSRWRT